MNYYLTPPEFDLRMVFKGDLVLDQNKPDGALHKTVDGSKGFRHFNWTPQIKLKEGILETIQWYERSLNERN